MPFRRIIARLDIKGPNVIKGIQMDGLRVIGPVGEIARAYYAQGVDEIIMIDTVASLYGREAMADFISDVTSDCFVPITVGGGIRSLSDADALFRAGADKIAINTAALAYPTLITEIAEKYGSQAVVVHIEAKNNESGDWECFTESGREPSGVTVFEWLKRAEKMGAGEFFITNVDRDGTMRGPDTGLLDKVCSSVALPVIASSGVGNNMHASQVFSQTECEGLAIGSALHYQAIDVGALRSHLTDLGISVRPGAVGND